MIDRRSFLELIAATFRAGACYVPTPEPPLTRERFRTPAIEPAFKDLLALDRFDIWHFARRIEANSPAFTLPFDFAVARMNSFFFFPQESISFQLTIGGYPVHAAPLVTWEDGQYLIEPPQFASVLLIPAGQPIELRSKGGPCSIELQGLTAARPPAEKEFF